MPLHISSPQNPRIRQVMALQKPRERKLSGHFVAEGVREVSLALQAGFAVDTCYVCEGIYIPDAEYPIPLEHMECVTVSQEVYARMAYREGTGGVLAVLQMQNLGLEQLLNRQQALRQKSTGQAGLYLVLERVEKPGNIGAMLRTADAAGLSGVIVCDPATDFYNPNVVRSSVGTLFTVPVAAASNEQTREWLLSQGVRSYATALSASRPYHLPDYRSPSAFLLGSEAHGLSDFWLKHADERIIVPMHGRIDSMNVSNTAAIVIFEALRQRM